METVIEREFKSLKLSSKDGVAHLRFAQPERANAMTREFWAEFPQALAFLKSNTDNRVLLISGEGKHFSSGMDLSIFAESSALNNSTAREREKLRRLVVDLQKIFTQLEDLPFPTIALLQGACIGAGLDLISACDMRYATKQAFFCVQEINLAMMADLGVLQRLPKLIPDGVARELVYTGDKLSAERAHSLGLLNAVFDTEEEMIAVVQQTAARIAARSPLAVSASKLSINYSRDHSVQESLDHAAVLQSAILDPDEIGNAAKAAAQKKEATFGPLLVPSGL